TRLLLCTMLITVAAAGVRAQPAPAPAPGTAAPSAGAAAPTPEATPSEPTQTTVVHGTPEDLSGRWLVLFDMKVNQTRRTMPLFLEITTTDGKPQLVERFVELPKDMAAELEKHEAAQTLWEPTPAQLATLAATWQELAATDRGILQVTTDIWEPSTFTEAEREEMKAKDAVWVMRETYQFAPGGQRPATQVNVFVGLTRQPNGWTGTGVIAQVIAAPFPVPITLDGDFRMLRVDGAAPAGGLLARILGAFKGCGR
ncbi:MAG TPA: hypothetical protein VNO26_03865, partial [Candidatus Limnocylindria bacterium]|nr:hypothetical protein [Candidatus Limnocylindria bacterium]